jgi:hypothetical protein
MPVALMLLSMLLLRAGPKAAMEPSASTRKITHPMPKAPAATAFISPAGVASNNLAQNEGLYID